MPNLWGQLVDSVPGDLTYTCMNSPLPRCVLYATDAETMTGNATTYLTFGAASEQSDPLAFHSTTTNTGRITPNVAGLYRVVTCVGASQVLGTSARIILRQNGSTIFASEAADLSGTAANTALSVTGCIKFNGTTDYVEVGITNGQATNRTTRFKALAVFFLGAV